MTERFQILHITKSGEQHVFLPGHTFQFYHCHSGCLYDKVRGPEMHVPSLSVRDKASRIIVKFRWSQCRSHWLDETLTAIETRLEACKVLLFSTNDPVEAPKLDKAQVAFRRRMAINHRWQRRNPCVKQGWWVSAKGSPSLEAIK